MPDADATESFLLGRLMQQRRSPIAVLKASPGRWRSLDGVHVLAVTEGLLWLACPRRVGDTSIASVPSSTVSAVSVRSRRPLGRRSGDDVIVLEFRVGDATLRYRCVDPLDACQAFAVALQVEADIAPWGDVAGLGSPE